MNHEILRDVSCLCSKLPVLDSSKFESEFYSVRIILSLYISNSQPLSIANQ